jgi:hypothetical protein
MFTARTVVVIVALAAGGVANSSARGIDHAFSVPSGTAATSVARPAIADERTPTSNPARVATAFMPLAGRVTAQKVTEDSK